MERKTPAILVLLAGLVIGFIGYFFFYEHDLGLSVPLFISLVLTTMIGFAWHNGAQLNLRRLWPVLPILFFASMFFLRANETILFADALAVLALAALMAAHFNGKYLDEVGLPNHLWAFFMAGLTACIAGFSEIAKALGWFKAMPKKNAPAQLSSILRGIFIALPILVVFAVLLSSADPIFQKQLSGLTDWFSTDWLSENLIEAVIIIMAIAWVMVGVIVFSISPSPVLVNNSNEEESPDKKRPRFISLNMTEAGIVLGGVVLLFAFFVFIQFTYLFGQQEIFLENMTFANYARRGFFELVTVCVMTLALMLGLDQVTLRRAQSQQVFFRLSSVVLVALTLVMLSSAWRRMSLYEEAYGFSHLRLYTHVFMIWLGILMLVALLDIFRVRAHIFTFGALLVVIGYLGSLNIINVDAYIAQHNIERYQAGEELDACYIRTLSVDAVPVVAEFYSTMEEGWERELLNNWLYNTQLSEESRADSSFLEANLSHQQAAEALSSFRFEYLEEDVRNCYTGYEDYR